MSKNKKTYMYYRISYSKKRDSYSTWVYVGDKKYPDWDDFGFEMEGKCCKAFIEETKEPTEDYCMVHFSFLAGIRQAIALGYKIEFLDRPEEEGGNL